MSDENPRQELQQALKALYSADLARERAERRTIDAQRKSSEARKEADRLRGIAVSKMNHWPSDSDGQYMAIPIGIGENRILAVRNGQEIELLLLANETQGFER